MEFFYVFNEEENKWYYYKVNCIPEKNYELSLGKRKILRQGS